MTLLLMYLNRLTKRNRYLSGCNIQPDLTCQVFLLHREQNFCNFWCNPCKIKFCIEEVSVGEISHTLLDSNGGRPHSAYIADNIFLQNKCKQDIRSSQLPLAWGTRRENGQEKDMYVDLTKSVLIKIHNATFIPSFKNVAGEQR